MDNYLKVYKDSNNNFSRLEFSVVVVVGQGLRSHEFRRDFANF